MERATNALGTKRFGAYLKRVRESRRLSLDAVEEASSIYPEPLTKSHLSRIENGRATPSFTRLFALGQIYGVPVSAMAERFEIEFRRDLVSDEWLERPDADAVREADHLRVSGRFVEAYALYSAMLERRLGTAQEDSSEVADLQLRRLAALTSAGAHMYAKSEAERLLGLRHFAPHQRVRLYEILTTSALRLGLVAVAQMALTSAETVVHGLERDDAPLRAHLIGLRGMLAHEIEDFRAAEEQFARAAEACEACGERPSALQMRINRGACLVRLDRHDEAKPLLLDSVREAESGGLERQLALALSHLAKLEAAASNAKAAEAYALRSNGIARARDYVDVVFRNCHILRSLALAAGDLVTARMHEKTLRTYVHRVEPNLSEARAFLSELSRSDA